MATIKNNTRTYNMIEIDDKGTRKALGAVDAIISEADNRTSCLHDYEVMYQANQRAGVACVKDRSEVSGGGKKPWKQKGTGRARHGSSRSPIWRSGGVTFGPKPRDYSYNLPKGTRNHAIKVVLKLKAADEKLFIINEFSIASGKTKDCVKLINKLGLNRPLVILPSDATQETQRATKNIPRTYIRKANHVCAHDILLSDDCVITKKGYDELLARFSNKKNNEKTLKEIKQS